VNKPTIDELLEQIDSKYSLVVIAAKRARSFTGQTDTDNVKGEKPVTRSLKEIAAGKLTYEPTKFGIK
jgi:DNA-directed RNA polymerase subunit omega